MEWIEVTGRTVEDAKELALDRLGVVEAELETADADADEAGDEGEPEPSAEAAQPEPASAWARLRRMLG